MNIRQDTLARSVVAALGAGVCLVAGGIPGAALAGPGDHIRFGQTEVVPQILLGTQYRSNVLLAEKDVQGGLSLIVHPSAALKLDGPKMKLQAAGAYDLRKYFDPDLTSLDRFRDGSLKGDLRLLPDSLLGFDVKESLVGSSRESESWNSDSALIQHTKNDLGARLAIHPGEALEGGLGGRFLIDDYNVPAEANVLLNPNYNSRLGYGPEASFKWRFFPRTAVVFDTSMEWFRWNHNLVNIMSDMESLGADSPWGDYLAIPDGWLFSVKGGLRGRFTERITLGLVAGYNDADYDEASVQEDPGAAAAGVEADPAVAGFDVDPSGAQKLTVSALFQYDLSETHKVVLGYDRAIADSYFTNYFVYDYVFLRYNVLLGARVGVGGEAGYRFENFFGEVTRADNVVRTRLGLNYSANRWLQANGSFQWDRRATVEQQYNTVDYDDFGVSLGVTFVY